jgi:uncharacterized membrane protein YcaP (DUF421 family)
MFDLSRPWWEFIVRALIVYLFLLVILRLTGKRQFGQMSPFDLVLLLIISNAVQNSMNAGDNSLLGGLISALTLLALNYGFGYLTYFSRRTEYWVEGRAEVLIHNGRLNKNVLEREKITHEELMSALRREGVAAVDQVHFAILENDGRISVKKRKEP